MGEYTFPKVRKTVNGVNIPLVNGLAADRVVTQEMRDESDLVAATRKEAIRASMKKVWAAYKEFAW